MSISNRADNKPEDLLKDPYVFEFTGLPELPVYKEGDLEDALITNLSQFLLELGKGFTYVGRQQRINIGGRMYKVDLVFYHRILKCFVLIDLKQGVNSLLTIGLSRRAIRKKRCNFLISCFRAMPI